MGHILYHFRRSTLPRDSSFYLNFFVNSRFVFCASENRDMIYEPLAKGVRHFKETPEGRHEMCESFEKLADKRVEQKTINMVKELMKNMKWSLEQALNATGIQGKERAIIAKQLQAQ